MTPLLRACPALALLAFLLAIAAVGVSVFIETATGLAAAL